MQFLAAKKSVLILAVMTAPAWGAVIDEMKGAPMGGAPGAPMGGAPMGGGSPLGAGENRAMRTAVSLNAIQAAFDNSDPRESIKRFTYTPSETFKLRLREYMSTVVILPKGEAVDAFDLGDKENFEFIPFSPKEKNKKAADEGDRLDNVFRIRPKYAGADTNLTVIGRSGRVYSFYLRSDSVQSPHIPYSVVYVEDRFGSMANAAGAAGVGSISDDLSKDKPAPEGIPIGQEKMTGEEAAAMAEYLRSLPVVDPKAIRLNAYKIVDGDTALAPLMVFDDGYWTYFKFTNDKNLDKAKVPTVYRVVDGYDTPANIRVEGGTIIAETTGNGWTLKSGEAHLCIRAK